jgi:Tol biopolymer transport system component
VAIYSRDDGTFRALPGADDPEYVQSNPVWSPDGKWIVFARNKRHDHGGTGRLGPEGHKVFTEQGKTFLFDLYRVPFNDGNGGRAEPLTGASENGMSNYFPRYSPDGKWIVFCKAILTCCCSRIASCTSSPAAEARRAGCGATRAG